MYTGVFLLSNGDLISESIRHLLVGGEEFRKTAKGSTPSAHLRRGGRVLNLRFLLLVFVRELRRLFLF